MTRFSEEHVARCHTCQERLAAEALAAMRERLARDIQQIPHTRAWVPDAEGEARNRGLDEALAVVRGVGEAKP